MSTASYIYIYIGLCLICLHKLQAHAAWTTTEYGWSLERVCWFCASPWGWTLLYKPLNNTLHSTHSTTFNSPPDSACTFNSCPVTLCCTITSSTITRGYSTGSTWCGVGRSFWAGLLLCISLSCYWVNPRSLQQPGWLLAQLQYWSFQDSSFEGFYFWLSRVLSYVHPNVSKYRILRMIHFQEFLVNLILRKPES